MRLESNIALFFIFLFGMLFFGYFCKKQKWENFLSKLFFVLFCSLLFPAFIPGHGEIIVALPNGALFTKMTILTWSIGLFYIETFARAYINPTKNEIIEFYPAGSQNGLEEYQTKKFC